MNKKILLILLCIVFAAGSIVLVACGKDSIGTFEWETYRGSSTAIGGNDNKVMESAPAKADEPTIALHYWRRNENDYKTWAFWLWADGMDGKEFPIQYQDDFGSVTLITLATLGVTEQGRVGIIPKTQGEWTKDGESDRFIDLKEYTKDANNYINVFLAQGDIALYKDTEQMNHGITAEFTQENRITIEAKSTILKIEIFENGETIAYKDDFDEEPTRKVYYIFPEDHPADAGSEYKIDVEFVDEYKATVYPSTNILYSSAHFNNLYFYDGDDLGAVYGPDSTTFKVWSPVSTSITLNIYNEGTGGTATQTVPMTKGDKGVWSATVSGNLEKKYYTYTVVNSSYPNGKEIVDPYAKSAGLNGARGQIVDFSNTNPTGWDEVSPKNYDKNELVVWETHVADVTSSATWNGTEANRKKFLGLIESGTTYTKGATTVKTGFDHIVELGVNAVQLVPIFDQSNDETNPTFNWGYNPLNYNVLEGSYSSDASDGYVRIKEFKQVVQAFNGKGINIIMDVVYNHVSAAVGSNFDVLMPGYYFRYTTSGDMGNGSGCGNETASNNLMFRKFMIDSVCFWAKEYKLGGFRFDLMGLHDIETMNQLAAALKKVNPSIVLYGEPWTGGDSPLAEDKRAIQKNAKQLEGVGQFNDQMRDALIAGGMKGKEELGWITQTDLNKLNTTDITKIVRGMQGQTYVSYSNIIDVTRTVNYVTCHDNYTLKDRIVATGKAVDAKKQATLANAMVLTSNGVTFMLAGEEFLRSKGDLATNAANDQTEEAIHNSYQSSYQMNSLNYELKADNKDMFDNYVKLIAFKKLFVTDFKLTSATAISTNYTAEQLTGSAGSAILVTITVGDKTYKIVHTNGTLGEVTIDLEGYTLYLDTIGATTQLSSQTVLSKYQTLIAYK